MTYVNVHAVTVEGVLRSVQKARKILDDNVQRNASDRQREKDAEEQTR